MIPESQSFWNTFYVARSTEIFNFLKVENYKDCGTILKSALYGNFPTPSSNDTAVNTLITLGLFSEDKKFLSPLMRYLTFHAILSQPSGADAQNITTLEEFIFAVLKKFDLKLLGHVAELTNDKLKEDQWRAEFYHLSCPFLKYKPNVEVSNIEIKCNIDDNFFLNIERENESTSKEGIKGELNLIKFSNDMEEVDMYLETSRIKGDLNLSNEMEEKKKRGKKEQ